MGSTVALIDGEHHPSVVRGALDELDRERGLAGVVFCGGEEKTGPAVLEAAAEHYGRPIETAGAEAGLRALAAPGRAVVDLADEPVLPPRRKLELAALALHLEMRYESPGLVLEPPPYTDVPFGGPKLAVIATGKRTGKTAVSGHWARLLRDRGVRRAVPRMAIATAAVCTAAAIGLRAQCGAVAVSLRHVHNMVRRVSVVVRKRGIARHRSTSDRVTGASALDSVRGRNCGCAAASTAWPARCAGACRGRSEELRRHGG